MGIPRKDPPKEACAKRDRLWEYVSVPEGAKVKGWLAGPPFWVPVHELGTTRPCTAEITENAIPCSVDHAKFPEKWRGYLPWWDEKYRRRGVWVSTPLKEFLESLPKFSPITLTRPKGDRRPLDVHHDELRAIRYAESESRAWPNDPSPTLLVIWGDLELSQWCRDHGGHGSVPGDTPAGRALTDEIAAALRVPAGDGASDTAVSSAERNRIFVEKVRGRKNGQH